MVVEVSHSLSGLQFEAHHCMMYPLLALDNVFHLSVRVVSV